MSDPSYNPGPAGAPPKALQFERLLEAAPDAMVIVDRTGRIVLANSRTEEIFGYSRAELLGQNVEILVPEQYRKEHAQHREGYAQSPRARPMGSGLELTGRRKDGNAFPVEISLSPLGEGEESLFTAAIRDVTDRKKADEALRLSEERFRLLVNEVKDYAIFMLDPEGRVASWNAGAEQIKGYKPQEIIGRHFSRFYPSEEVEAGKPEQALKQAAAEGRVEDEGWRIRKDGSRFWASVVITALHDSNNKLRGFTKVTRDITEGKRARDAFLLEISNTLASHLDIRELLTAVAACLRQVKQFDEATLALYDSQSKMLRVQTLEPSAKATEELLIPLGGSPAGWAYTARRPLLMKGTANETLPYDVRAQLSDASVKSACWIPLLGQEGVLGTLNLYSRRAATFTEDDLGILTQMANQIAIALGNALAFRRISELTAKLAQEKQYLEDELRTEFNFEEIVGESNVLKRVLKQIETVAPTDSTVLILGETGTGKELIARAVHDLSARREHNFVRVNCASIPTGLLESELFGHEKGAFTGAIAQRIGRLELAHQGTIFLDEVGDIPLELQPKLLRVLQERQFERLGTSRTITVDVRIVAATNRDLGKMVSAGQFRSDLFYRLSVFPIIVPPLRDRRDDIPLLVHYFIAQFGKRMNKKIESVAAETMQALLRYPWPGNIRELEHLIERAVILSRGPVLTVPQVELAQAAANPSPGAGSMEEMEREHIVRALKEAGGKIGGPGGAAERLGMNRTTLNSRMQKLGISRKDV